MDCLHKSRVDPPENRFQNFENVCKIHNRNGDTKNIDKSEKMYPKVSQNPCKFRRSVLKNEVDQSKQEIGSILAAKGKGDRRMGGGASQIRPDPRVAFIQDTRTRARYARARSHDPQFCME